MKKILKSKGFTLVELMVVIVIVGILAAVAIPKFTVASHKAKASEFPTVLSSIYSSEHTWEAEQGVFHAAANQAALEILGVSVPSSKYFDYTCTVVGGTNFSATADVSNTFGDATAGSDEANIGYDGIKSATPDLATYAPSWTS